VPNLWDRCFSICPLTADWPISEAAVQRRARGAAVRALGDLLTEKCALEPLSSTMRLTARRKARYESKMAKARENEGDRPKAASKGTARAKRSKPADRVALPAPHPALTMVDPDLLPSGCPPADAIDGPILLFRLAATKKLAASDCLTPYEAGTFLKSDPCRRRSLSSFKDRLDAERLRRRVPHFNAHHVCEGVVPAGAGVHLATPSQHEKSHWSWWPSKSIVRHRFFIVAT
jgi:hypothetical protein